MKNIFTKLFLIPAAILCSSSLNAQSEKINADADVSPFNGNAVYNPAPQSQTPWQILFNYDLLAKTGANGAAGVCQFGTELWVSRWANDSIFRFDLTGNLLQRFTVTGVTGTRSFTTDGTSIYAGTNNTNVYKINPVTKTLIATITSPIANVRSLTYDPTANSNAGGFWGSTWATDITLFSMTGTNLNTPILAANHTLTGMYGTAYDNTSPGGPYLWVFDQASSPSKSDIVRIKISTGMPSGVIHNVMGDVGTAAADTSGLAGGIFVRSSPLSIIGVLQGNPTNRLFAYDITGVGVENIDQKDFIGIYPNPVKDYVNIHLNLTNNSPVNFQVFDVLGNLVYEDRTNGLDNYFNLSRYNSGIYFIKVTYEGKVYTSKLIKQ